MNRAGWIVAVVVAIVCAGGGYWYGTTHASAARTGGGAFAGRAGGAGAFAGRGAGGTTFGTILSIDSGSMTVQLPNSTSTAAQTGTKIVLFDGSTQVEELQSVGISRLAQGQSVMVSGSANPDGSITAQSIQIRPASMRAFGAQ